MSYRLKTLKNIVKSIIDNDFFGMASEMGFMLVIGICPFLMFLTAVFGWLGKHSFMEPLFAFMQQVMPEEVFRLIKTVLNEVIFYNKGGFVAILGFVITLILSTNALAIVLKGLNRAYKVEETRSFLYTRVLSLIMVFVNALILFLCIDLIIFGKIIINFLITYIGLNVKTGNIMLFFRWPIAFLSLFVMAYIHYYILPDLSGKENVKRRSTIPGTLFFCVSWLLGSWGFSVYINNLHTYNFVYGTIAGFAVLMVWLYYTSILILIGGEINSQLFVKLERKEEIMALRDKTSDDKQI